MLTQHGLFLAVAVVLCLGSLTGCKDPKMSPDAFKNPCLGCNIDKPKPLQSINRVGDEAFARDASGEMISRDVGGPIDVGHGGAPGTGFTVQPIQLQLKDGSWIDATRSLHKSTTDGITYVTDHRLDTDCHGVSFTNGKYWINDPDVPTVLSGGGFRATATPKPGDIGVYTDASGNVVHSVTVTKVDPVTGKVLEVSGLGGLEMHEHVNTPADAWADPNATITYYTK